MKCPRCQQESPADADFCPECGAKLAVLCVACGIANAPAHKYCKKCGQALGVAVGLGEASAPSRSPSSYTPKHLAEKILTSKSALEGERKQVTVLFADLKGSMELLADRDPEEARKILDPVLELMMEAVHRYEGTVNQVMGDGVMALFGAPLAHEDHAVRACFAALWMQEAVRRYGESLRRAEGVPIRIRVGLNSGQVVVRAIAGDLHMDYTAVGQTTHLAARMEQLAAPDTIALTGATLALAEGFIEVRALGPIPVKGLADPVEVYEATGTSTARTRLQASARRGLTRFVGRDAQIEDLDRARQLADNGRGQVFAIVGEAGVGKSRLVYEFTRSHRQHGWLVLETAAASYGTATGFLSVNEILKTYFRITDRDGLRDIREKVTGKLITLDEALKPSLPALLALLDVPVDDPAWNAMTPAHRRQRTLDSLKRVFLRETHEQPVLLVFEDLHWIDPESQAFLDALVNSLGSARLLLLVNYRPEYQHTWASKTSYTQLMLGTLPDDSTNDLLVALLGVDPGLAPLKRLLIRRGNPFFLEEVVRTLAEAGTLVGEPGRYQLTQPIDRIKVPTTVESVLAARIDRLLPDDKDLLQVASVVGRDVPFMLLQALVGTPDDGLRAGLGRLQAAEFIYEARLFPDLEYSFKHALTHEVAYRGLVQERRRALHARVVETLEGLHADRISEHTERLAHHAVQADLQAKAVHYLRRAGLKAAARSALPEARTFLDHALELLQRLPEGPTELEQAVDIRLDLRPVLAVSGESRLVLRRLSEAEVLAQRLADEGRRGRALALMTDAHTSLGELDEALVTGGRALDIARRSGDLHLRILATTQLENAHWERGDYERVVELATENLALLPPDAISPDALAASFGRPAAMYDRYYLVLSLTWLGRFKEAAEHAADAIRLAESTRHPSGTVSAYFGAAILHIIKGDSAKARPLYEHTIAIATNTGVVMGLPTIMAGLAWALAELGEMGQAQTRAQEAKELLDQNVARGSVMQRPVVYRILGRTSLLLGRLDDARRLAERAIESSPHQLGWAAIAWHLLGDVVSDPDRFDAERSEAHYRQALDLAEPLGMRPLVAHCHFGLGKLYRRTGKREQAREHLATATTMYREMGMTYWLEKAEAEQKA